MKALSIDAAAECLGYSVEYMKRLIYYKKIPHYKPTKGKIFFNPDDLDAFIYRNRVAADYEQQAEACNILNEK